ncbi:hypothetical protein FBZ93_11155 [Bradyrhizobium macuxiense]|uniref:Uncharacterized protein n=1 Tax=Bradyrhizobium macuxiense TaxID=1755647 RepID=A0A560LBR2_9BRAD|nr:hypothetical protein [Bradyrhizobium macuxiense]TWB93016.1 hypothetical protein FBZ93_11155 [Bradyrhizobium macuxiense]
MDVASDRLKAVHASKWRLVKNMRERNALRELSNREAKRRIAVEAVARASVALARAEESRATVETELYQELVSSDPMPVTELDRRCHLVIGRFTAEIASARQALEEACMVREQAETAVLEARTVWVKRSAATHKWQQIECDVQRTSDAHSEFAAEIEADDEVLLRYRRGSRTQAAGDSI